MKKAVYLLAIIILSCASKKQDRKQPPGTADTSVAENKKTSVKTDSCWTGTLNGRIPVFVHYQVTDSLLTGNITYLQSKNKKPIRLLGDIKKDSSYQLLEFETSGNITGILTGKPSGNNFTGVWTSPEGKEMSLSLRKIDTVIYSVDITADPTDLQGDYHYQFGESGYQGNVTIKRMNNNKISFSIFSVTSAPGRNIADVPEDTIDLQTPSFIYTVPDSDNCSFRVHLYKDFIYIKYTQNHCPGQFGLNATVEGIYLKINTKSDL